VKGCIGFIDGTVYRVPTPHDPSVATTYFSYKIHRPGINNVFVFANDGTIIWAKYNCPGSYHDSKICESLYTTIEQTITPPYCFVADTAFRVRGLDGRIKKPADRNATNLSNHRVLILFIIGKQRNGVWVV
jgi:hypothetical protein